MMITMLPRYVSNKRDKRLAYHPSHFFSCLFVCLLFCSFASSSPSHQYLEAMIDDLTSHNAHLTKLSGFFLYGLQDSFAGYWDLTLKSELVSKSGMTALLSRDTGQVVLKYGAQQSYLLVCD
jgi:hypothetical protein